ncbi:MAG: serine acetyltransferase [Desulfobacterota bacterium]|nr:serine acetyltransferase [Thermodesulfobacteriota bacterium]
MANSNINEKIIKQVCELNNQTQRHFRTELKEVIENILETGYNYNNDNFAPVFFKTLPDQKIIVEIINRIKEVIFPEYFYPEKIDLLSFKYQIGQSIIYLFEILSKQITQSLQHECLRHHNPCIQCIQKGGEEAIKFLKNIPNLRRLVMNDVQAAYSGDPAAKSIDEIILSYPGVFAVMVYRIAHELYKQQIPLIPRIMTEYAHRITGIDIHPGAEIGESFFIDHGTGVVIGETTKIGKNVRIYQGVTLGALSLPRDAGEKLRGKKRHPTIEDNVIIYAGATLLGEKAVIGAGSIIGGNLWITSPVPPDTRVIGKEPNLIYKKSLTSVER